MNKANDIMLTAGSSTGIFFGISIIDVYYLLGIIVTAINLVILCITIINNIRKRMSDGEYTNEERAETAKEILQLKETINELNKQIENKNKEDK